MAMGGTRAVMIIHMKLLNGVCVSPIDERAAHLACHRTVRRVINVTIRVRSDT